MIEILIMAVFVAGLFACLLLLGTPVYALLFGFVLFFGYGLFTGKKVRRMLACATSGVRSAQGVLAVLLLVGLLTASWRASGTMAYMVQQVVNVCPAQFVLLASFLLCCAVSFLVGSAFGTVATVGVICTMVATSAAIPLALAAGAVLSGAYFGDRCSPVSGSAHLVASLTKTTPAANLRMMVKTSAVPFAITCVLFGVLGWVFGAGAQSIEAPAYLAECYSLSAIDIVPALAVFVLALFGLNSFAVLSVGVACGVVVAVFAQGCSVLEVLSACIFGYVPAYEGASMLAGGGLVSMLSPFAIILVSSCYAGMFEETGLLANAQHMVEKIARKFGSFAAVFTASLFTSVITCNQTLGIVCTHQLCASSVRDGSLLAAHLENTVVLVAALVPWSSALAVPLAVLNAPLTCIFSSFYIYLVPLAGLCAAFASRHMRAGAQVQGARVASRA